MTGVVRITSYELIKKGIFREYMKFEYQPENMIQAIDIAIIPRQDLIHP